MRVAAAVIGASSLLLVGALAALALLYTSPELLSHYQTSHGFMELRFTAHRKLLAVRGGDDVEEPDRVWGEKCSRSDIVIDQGSTGPLPSGIPTYTVEIMNVCGSGCNISRIHLSCGWFSSATLVNPRVFKRLRYNDCLVNEGKPLFNGGSISFEYANSFLYPLKVSSVVCY